MTTSPFRVFSTAVSAALAISLGALTQTASAEIAVKSGEKIAFLGDSITAQGWSNADGYVHLVIAGLAANGVDATPIAAGIGGHKSNDMLARLNRDVLSKKPDWMTLSCGVNDVWHDKKGVPLDDAMAASGEYEKPDKGTYKKNITEILDKAAAAKVKVVVLTATVIHEATILHDNPKDPFNQKLIPYNDFLRSTAKERHLPLADLNATFQERIKAENQPKNILTGDGVHMIRPGNELMATGILTAFGLDSAQLKKAQNSWASLEAEADKQAAEKRAAKAKADAEAKAKAAAATPAAATPAAK